MLLKTKTCSKSHANSTWLKHGHHASFVAVLIAGKSCDMGFVELCSVWLDQGSPNYGPWAKSGPSSRFIRPVKTLFVYNEKSHIYEKRIFFNSQHCANLLGQVVYSVAVWKVSSNSLLCEFGCWCVEHVCRGWSSFFRVARALIDFLSWCFIAFYGWHFLDFIDF